MNLRYLLSPMVYKRALSLLCLLIAAPFSALAALEGDGKIGIELLSFFEQEKYDEQHQNYTSYFFDYSLYHSLNDTDELRAQIFYRNDAQSDSRTHFDIRELMWSSYGDDYEINAGIGKVFWGVTESRHLVDVINQVDLIEDIDDEARLGQAMFNSRYIKDWGTVDLFILPGFRKQEFASEDTRPRAQLVVDEDSAIYQDEDKDAHIDWAARWNHSIDDLDVGVSFFSGTQRSPLLIQEGDELVPVYVQTEQTGIDAQYVIDDWLLKFESVYRASHDTNFNNYDTTAAVAGFEYTFVGIGDSRYDLGVLTEYLYDEWQELTPFEDDLMAGFRLVFNDEFDTEVLLTQIVDVDKHSRLWLLSFERRLAESITVEVTGRWVSDVADDDALLQTYEQEDLIDIKLSYYF